MRWQFLHWGCLNASVDLRERIDSRDSRLSRAAGSGGVQSTL
jgi:hypothetical protein